jgi:hypothetical protein
MARTTVTTAHADADVSRPRELLAAANPVKTKLKLATETTSRIDQISMAKCEDQLGRGEGKLLPTR